MEQSDEEMISRAFERSAPHISNISEIKRLLDHLLQNARDYSDVIASLRENMQTVEDVTLRTDIRILLNEIDHALRNQGRYG